MKPIFGAITALVTPMQNGRVDEKSLIDLIEFQIASGIHALLPCGTTGESATLSFEEHKGVIDLCVQTVAGRVPVIAGTGANNTLEAIELTESAKKSGADAVLSVTPYYNKPSQEGLYQHFAAIARAVDIPIVLYNVPGRTGVNMLPATVARLAEIPQVVAIKEASGNLPQISELLMCCPRDFIVLSGDDFTALPSVYLGAKGVISVVSNLEPGKMAKLMDAALKGNMPEANRLHFELFHLMGAMFCYPSPAPAKKGLELMGRIASADLRLPMTTMDEPALARLEQDMRELGLI